MPHFKCLSLTSLGVKNENLGLMFAESQLFTHPLTNFQVRIDDMRAKFYYKMFLHITTSHTTPFIIFNKIYLKHYNTDKFEVLQ